MTAFSTMRLDDSTKKVVQREEVQDLSPRTPRFRGQAERSPREELRTGGQWWPG